MKKIASAALALLLAFGSPAAFAETAAESEGIKVFADWQFNESSVIAGSVEGGDLQLADHSGNGNTIKMNTYGNVPADIVSFSDEGVIPSQGSMLFNSKNDDSGAAVYGADFVTVDNAPINTNSFENGYTIEILYKMPDDWNYTDRWTSLLSRLGRSYSLRESEYNDEASSLISVSNCKEIQIIAANKDDSHVMTSDAWSIAMDKAENWYSIVITSDGSAIRTYVNGAESFRDYVSDEMIGLYADPSDGRFRIASRVKTNGKPYRFTRGYIQEIRISEGALSRENWLLPNPEQYLGEYGNNENFTETPNDRYNFVFLPDVQNTVQFMPDVLYKAMNWMVENQDYANISAVLGLGDNVNDFWATDQWNNVTKAMKILTDGGIKLLMMPGNHDTTNGTDENRWYYDKYFGINSEYLKAADYVTNDSPSGFSSYMKVKAGSYTYLLMEVGMYSYSEDEAWIRNVLEENSSLPTIFISHDMQNCSDTKPNEIKLSTRGNAIWNIVKQYDNVFLMVGGHSHGYGNETLQNNYGHDVFSVLADYQFSYNGGNAFFKFAEFDEKGGKIRISTFSPYVQTLADEDKSFFDVNYMTGKGNYDELDIDFSERFSFAGKEVSYGENLIENFSFEENTDGWTYNNGGVTGALSGWERSTDFAHDGSYSLRQTASVGSASPENLGTFIPIEPGKKYKLTYWEYSTMNTTGGYNQMNAAVVTSEIGATNDLSIQLIDCGGHSSWYNESKGISPRDLNYYTGWTQRSYTFDTTDAPNAKYILLAYAWGNKGTLYIDDFSLTEIIEEYPVSFGAVTAERTEDGVNVWSVINNASNADKLCYIAAGYNTDGQLVSICAKTNADTAELSGLELKLEGSGIAKVKLFCWESLSSMRDLCESKTVEIFD